MAENLIDPKIYKKANQRAHFKFHLAIYVLVMLVLWILYFFLFRATAPDASVADAVKNTKDQFSFFDFTVLVTALWTVIVVFHGLFIYKFNSSMLEKEIKALQKELAEQETLKKALMEQKQRSNAEQK